MPRDELAPWQKAAIEPLFHSVAEWSAEAIGGANAAPCFRLSLSMRFHTIPRLREP